MKIRSNFAGPAILGPLLWAIVSASAAAQCPAGKSIAISNTADLDFGSLISTASAGTVVMDPASGGRTVTGGVLTAGGAFGPASFDVLLCGPAGPKRFDVLLPASVVLSGSGGGTMTVGAFTASPGTSGVGASESIPTQLRVGATLTVAASQTPGTYTGVFAVTVVRN